MHEPLIRDGVPSPEMAEELGELIGELLPQTTPLMVYLHRNFLRHSVEQDVIANMESDLLDDEREALGQLRVAIAFADLVGFVRFTEEEGEEEALDLVETLRRRRSRSRCPRSARVVKNIGDGVMIVGHRPRRADGLGDRLPGGLRAALAPAHRHPLRPHRSTGTATTSGAT